MPENVGAAFATWQAGAFKRYATALHEASCVLFRERVLVGNWYEARCGTAADTSRFPNLPVTGILVGSNAYVKRDP